MGWDQSYSFADEVALLEKITGKSARELLEQELQKLKLSFTKRDSFPVDEYSFVSGNRVTLSDGRIFEHKLERRDNTDDTGHDSYGWYESHEKPKVVICNPFDNPEG